MQQAGSGRYVVREGISSTTLPDGGGVLLDLQTDECFSLNAVGVLVWQGIEQGADLEEVAASIAATFSAPVERVRTDVVRLVEVLHERGLLLAAD